MTKNIHPVIKATVNSISYDFVTKAGYVYLPDASNVNMAGCIEFFTNIDPEVARIYTFAGGEIDTCYWRHGDEWQSATVNLCNRTMLRG